MPCWKHQFCSNSEVKQHWALDSTWLGNRLKTPGAADKKPKLGSVAGACKPSRLAANSFKAYRLWESLNCVPNCLLATAAKQSSRVLATWMGPDHVELWKWPKSCREGMAANQRWSGSEGHRFQTRSQQGLIVLESPLKCTLPPVICIHTINSCVTCIGWLFICFTSERCNMSSVNKRSTRATLL